MCHKIIYGMIILYIIVSYHWKVWQNHSLNETNTINDISKIRRRFLFMFMLGCATDTVTNKIFTDKQISSFPARAKRIVHYNDVIMGTMVSEITSLAIVYSDVYSGVDHRKHQSSASLAFVRGIHRPPAQMASNAENVSIMENGCFINSPWKRNFLPCLTNDKT